MKIVTFLFSLSGIITGLLVFFRPADTIAIQIKFYEKINWRMEPVSMGREVRNTKLTGSVLLIFSLISLFFLLQ